MNVRLAAKQKILVVDDETPSTAKTPSAGAPGKKNPDVIVTHGNQTVLFKTQNRRVAEWLRRHYSLSEENTNGEAEIRVHPTRCKRITAELKAAGFTVTNGREELC